VEKLAVHKRVEQWADLVKLDEDLSRSEAGEWIFRGESRRYERPLETTLGRVCRAFGVDGESRYSFERHLLTEFKRVYGVYSPTAVPHSSDQLQWLSIMRHYGAPTRLLDFSFSLFVASFFAIENPISCDDAQEDRPSYHPAAIWAISRSWLTEHFVPGIERIGGRDLLSRWNSRDGDVFTELFWNKAKREKGIFSMNPYSIHQRLHVQQGLFLCPGDITCSFENNLLHYNGFRDNVRIIEVDSSCRTDVLTKLRRVGVSRETLFPGLDGFAQSLSIAGPLLFLRNEKLAKLGLRVPNGVDGEPLWDKYLEMLRTKQKANPDV
jgi:hypothetical protein